jgi:asparagine synthetase B (glutamine-hydrolysing)
MSWVAALTPADGGPRLVVTVEAGSAPPQQAEREPCTVVFEGRLHSGQPNAADTVLETYLRGGDVALRRVDGWFTLLVWDAREQTLFALRDPLGVQPFFYANRGDDLRASPTVDALLRSDPTRAEANTLAIAADLLGQPRPPAETFFSGIRRLPPGHILTLRSGGVRVERYWQPVWNGQAVADDDAAERLEEVLRAAVTRCIEPGPAGVFLSGGLDSALVAAVTADACREHGRPAPLMLSAFFAGTDADEESTQREVAGGLGLEQLALTADDAVEDGRVLGAAIHLAADASRPPELLQPIYERLTIAARGRGVSVALSGAGGDELLMPPANYARERFRALDVPALVQLGRASVRYWPGATRRSVAHSLLVRSGVRPLIVGAASGVLGRVAPARLSLLRASRAARAMPEWLVPGEGLRDAQLEQVVTDGQFLDHVSLSYVREQDYDTSRRLGVRSFSPLLEPDVVAMLLNLAPRRLIDRGEAKSLAREVLAPRLPQLARSWPRTVYADSLWQQALRREGVSVWSALGGMPLLAELGVVEPQLLEARIHSGEAAAARREAVRVCRALILESWMASRILGRSARRVG